MRVPTLVTDNGDTLIQSIAIIAYLDETHPEPPLLPKDPVARAKVRGIAELIACDIHPLNNTSPLRYLKHQLGQEQSAIDTWYHHWVREGFEALEALIAARPLRVWQRHHARRYLPGAADRQRAPAQGAARQISEDRRRRRRLYGAFRIRSGATREPAGRRIARPAGGAARGLRSCFRHHWAASSADSGTRRCRGFE